MRKNKKPLIAMIALLIVGIVGVTFAYFSDSISFKNIFKTGVYKTRTVEEFSSPTNWTPGDVTEKSITTTNEGDYPVAVRLSYSESWVKNDHILEEYLFDEHGDPTDEKAAILNLDNEDDWVKVGNYYYYNKKLNKNETTSSWLESVEFNSGADAYWADATYTLTINVETVQFDSYKEQWSISYDIPEE